MGIPSLAILVGILINNSRLSELRIHMDMRFAGIDQRPTDMRAVSEANLPRVEEKFKILP